MLTNPSSVYAWFKTRDQMKKEIRSLTRALNGATKALTASTNTITAQSACIEKLTFTVQKQQKRIQQLAISKAKKSNR